MATLTIDFHRFQELRAEQGLDTDQSLAAALGVNKSTTSRVLSGKAAPGARFISSVLLTFPVKFEDLFNVVGDDDANDGTQHVADEHASLAAAS